MILDKTMTEYVKDTYERITDPCKSEQSMFNYANFISQHLNVGMFVPAVFKDNEWVVLEEPNRSTHTNEYCLEYQKAKDNVLFEGFEEDSSFVTHKSHSSFFYRISSLSELTIEDLIPYKLTLTATGEKLIK